MGDWKDILSGEEEKLSDEELMKYLDGGLSEQEKQAFEKKTVDSQFVNDAIDGLSQFKNKQKLDDYVKQLNNDLRKNLSTRKERVEKRRIKDNQWVLLAILIILAICVIVYGVIRMYHRQSPNNSLNINRTGIITKTTL